MRYSLIICCLLLFSCNSEKQQKKEDKQASWGYEKTIELDSINPIGIFVEDRTIYLSDGDRNRVVAIDSTGKQLSEYMGLERPMHIDAAVGTSGLARVYVPEYGRDSIAIINNEISYLAVPYKLDSPASVAVYKDEVAIADFYGHRILYKNASSDWMALGHEGDHDGDFYYPTDVQITQDAIFVADAYNNRVQRFDKSGKHIKTLGKEDNINAALGIYVTKEQVLVTDFENSRILVYDLQGALKQELKQAVLKPTDIFVKDDLLYISNYRAGQLVQYRFQ